MAWFFVIAHWLRIHGHVTVGMNGKVSPVLLPDLSY